VYVNLFSINILCFSYIINRVIFLKKFKSWNIAGFIFTLISGVLLHFAYEWSGENPIVSFIAPVNESIWEHLKLIFWPTFFFMIAEYFAYGKSENDFFAIRMSGIFCSIAFTVISFYTYSGILGFNLFGVDIAIFLISVFCCRFVIHFLTKQKPSDDNSMSFRGLVVILLWALCFVLWTHNPPSLAIFM